MSFDSISAFSSSSSSSSSSFFSMNISQNTQAIIETASQGRGLCPVYMESYAVLKNIVTLMNCGHNISKKALDELNKQSAEAQQCPLCRKQITLQPQQALAAMELAEVVTKLAQQVLDLQNKLDILELERSTKKLPLDPKEQKKEIKEEKMEVVNQSKEPTKKVLKMARAKVASMNNQTDIDIRNVSNLPPNFFIDCCGSTPTVELCLHFSKKTLVEISLKLKRLPNSKLAELKSQSFGSQMKFSIEEMMSSGEHLYNVEISVSTSFSPPGTLKSLVQYLVETYTLPQDVIDLIPKEFLNAS